MKLIVGRKPVLEAINSGREIDQVIVSFGQRNAAIDKIRIAAKKHGIKFTQMPPQKFKKYEKGGNTQGVVAITIDYHFYEVEELIDISKPSKYPLLLILDTVQDTHNLGAILRTAETAGVEGVIVTANNSAPLNETVEKTSAGALSHIRIAKVNNLRNAIELLKGNGFWVIGTSLKAKQSYTETDYKMPVALVMGNEEKGIRKLTADLCDILVKIPMKGNLQSLNVSVSTGILLYEILRQRES
jgi:23S rRNA (guanosine2251-2'-O)-methyltransferase